MTSCRATLSHYKYKSPAKYLINKMESSRLQQQESVAPVKVKSILLRFLRSFSQALLSDPSLDKLAKFCRD